MSNLATAANDEAVMRAIIQHFLTFGARASEDASWLLGVLPAELQSFFPAEVSAAIVGTGVTIADARDAKKAAKKKQHEAYAELITRIESL